MISCPSKSGTETFLYQVQGPLILLGKSIFDHRRTSGLSRLCVSCLERWQRLASTLLSFASFCCVTVVQMAIKRTTACFPRKNGGISLPWQSQNESSSKNDIDNTHTLLLKDTEASNQGNMNVPADTATIHCAHLLNRAGYFMDLVAV